MQGRKRWVVILGLTVGVALALIAFAGAFLSYDADLTADAWAYISVSSLLFVTSQVIFVLPMVMPPKLSTTGRSLRLNILVASFVGATLTVIFAMLVASIITTMIFNLPEEDGWGLYPLLYSGIWIFNLDTSDFTDRTVWLFIGFLCMSWFIWSLLLYVFVRRRKHDPSALVRITSWLFAGSIVELMLSIPLFIMVNRRSDCYCQTGAFGALVMSVFACLWLFGPCMLIVLIWRKRPWIKDHCYRCGYPRKVVGAGSCSECGTSLN